jgi:organic radical activating enzyme
VESELLKIVPSVRPYVSIVWQVSDWCNFRCSYCSEYNWGGKNRNTDVTQIKKSLEKIFDHYKELQYQDFKLFFSGGEPTYWEPLVEIMDFAKEQLPRVKFAINTNLSRDLSWWEKHYHYFDDVVCSFHIEGARPNRYLENYAFLQDKMNYLVARMMMHDERFDEVLQFRDLFKKTITRYKLEYVPLFRELSNKTEEWHYEDPKKRAFFETNSFERSEFEEFKPRSLATTSTIEVYSNEESRGLNSNRLVAERKNHFAGWKCWIHESIFINSQGDVSFATCGQTPVAGNIFKDDLKLNSEPIICKKKQCHCGTDICITKAKQ